MRYRLHTMPDMFVVLIELAVRSRRDPAIAQILQRLNAGWHEYLVQLLKRGVNAGLFRSDLDLSATAAAIMTQLKAIGYQAMEQPDMALVDLLVSQLAAQMERWLHP